MRRYLVVAHQTLGTPELLDAMRDRLAEGPCTFHLVVPELHQGSGARRSEGQVKREAAKHMEDARLRFLAEGIPVTGEVGDASPVDAVTSVLREQGGDFVRGRDRVDAPPHRVEVAQAGCAQPHPAQHRPTGHPRRGHSRRRIGTDRHLVLRQEHTVAVSPDLGVAARAVLASFISSNSKPISSPENHRSRRPGRSRRPRRGFGRRHCRCQSHAAPPARRLPLGPEVDQRRRVAGTEELERVDHRQVPYAAARLGGPTS